MFRESFIKVKFKSTLEREEVSQEYRFGMGGRGSWHSWPRGHCKQDPGTSRLIPLGSGTKHEGRAERDEVSQAGKWGWDATQRNLDWLLSR